MSKVLVEPLINGLVHGYAIQAKKFSLELKITNIDSSPSEAFDISSVVLKSAEGQDIIENFQGRKFYVEKINPGESKVISIGNNGQFMYGLVSIKIAIKLEDTTKEILAVQKNPFTNEYTDMLSPNMWVDFLYIKSAAQSSQEKSNKWLMRLTWVTAIFAFIQILPVLRKISDFLIEHV